jgi:hypothetical protein
MGLRREVGGVRWKMRMGFRWEVDEKRGWNLDWNYMEEKMRFE